MDKKLRGKTTPAVLLLFLFLSGCAGPQSQKAAPTPVILPTNIPTAVASATWTAEPTLIAETATDAPTRTPAQNTATPTAISLAKPASLSGNITFTAKSKKPFMTVIELRQGEGFKLIGSAKTNFNGKYSLSAIQPGSYGLWVLFNTRPLIPTGCRDILLPSSDWALGLEYLGDLSLTAPGNSLQKLMLISKNINDASLQVKGFYAVMPNLEITSGTDKSVDLNFMCW
jgi:hypothetical protein